MESYFFHTELTALSQQRESRRLIYYKEGKGLMKPAKLNVKLTWIVSALIGLSAVAVQAAPKKRYLVTFKSQQGYQAMNNYYRVTESAASSRFIQKSLNNIHAMIMKTSDENYLKALANHPEVASVQQEVFTPAPAPVNRLNISSQELGDISTVLAGRKKKPKDPKVPGTEPGTPAVPEVPAPGNPGSGSQADNNPGVPVFQQGEKTPWGILAVHATDVWADAQAGKNARVLVLDTGIDVEHEALKANIEKTKNFFPKSENDNDVDPTDIEDKIGHGSHCSGTIAGVYNEQTGFTGVAPLAKILMGRVCGLEGCSNISVAEGIDWGIQEKVDVISMSLGGPQSTPYERNAVAAAETAGVIVVAASGNDGIPRVSFPAALPTVIAVGAVDSSIHKTDFSQWGPELAIMAPGAGVLSSVPRGTGQESKVEITIDGQKKLVKSSTFGGVKLIERPISNNLVFAAMGKPEELAKANVAGKFALVSRGEIKFMEKIKNAMDAKAAGIVIYNNAPGLLQGVISEGELIDFPIVMIEQDIGTQLAAKLSEGGKVSATLQTIATDYALYDGTSMATPHVAGVMALVRSANKNITPAQARELVRSTAWAMTPNDQNKNGAGLIRADNFVKAVLALKKEATAANNLH